MSRPKSMIADLFSCYRPLAVDKYTAVQLDNDMQLFVEEFQRTVFGCTSLLAPSRLSHC
jgi:hypothetical protein